MLCCPRASLFLRGGIILAFAFLLTSAYMRVSSPAVMSEAAKAYLASLTPDQRSKGTFDLKDEELFFWHF
ncbi:MAG: hypothetical protein JNL62_21875, partial [Bryobacterales bacterium]|nr:hypothetical protein [Bryobacterales bacterium]